MTEAEMPLTAHLEELRWRIVKSLLAITVGFLIAYAFADSLFALLIRPINLAAGDNGVRLIGTGVTEAFFTKLKVAFVAGIFVAAPAVLYQVWQFVAPGLYDTEKKYVFPFVFFGTFFFVAGALFCYEFVFQIGYAFFLDQYASIGVEPTIRISEYLSFTSRMLLAFAGTFEMPVLAFFLTRIGLIDHNTLIRPWRFAVLALFIIAAVLTPGPDVASQMMLVTPLLILYGVSIGIAYFFATPRPDADKPANDDAEG
jgi:sec-independent protein translocase protein TatC